MQSTVDQVDLNKNEQKLVYQKPNLEILGEAKDMILATNTSGSPDSGGTFPTIYS